jgi:hypothetical protein
VTGWAPATAGHVLGRDGRYVLFGAGRRTCRQGQTVANSRHFVLLTDVVGTPSLTPTIGLARHACYQTQPPQRKCALYAGPFGRRGLLAVRRQKKLTCRWAVWRLLLSQTMCNQQQENKIRTRMPLALFTTMGVKTRPSALSFWDAQLVDNNSISDGEGGFFTGSSQFQVTCCTMNDIGMKIC